MAGVTQFHRAFTDTLARNQGFRVDHRMTIRFDPTIIGYTPAQAEQFYKTLIQRSEQAPGIKSAALSLTLPMTYEVDTERVTPEGYSFPPGKETIAKARVRNLFRTGWVLIVLRLGGLWRIQIDHQ